MTSGSGMSVVVGEIASVASGIVVSVGLNEVVPATVAVTRVPSNVAVGVEVLVGFVPPAEGTAVVVGVFVSAEVRVEVGVCAGPMSTWILSE